MPTVSCVSTQSFMLAEVCEDIRLNLKIPSCSMWVGYCFKFSFLIFGCVCGSSLGRSSFAAAFHPVATRISVGV